MHPATLDIVGANDVAGPAPIVAFEIVATLLDLEPDLDRCQGIRANSRSGSGLSATAPGGEF